MRQIRVADESKHVLAQRKEGVTKVQVTAWFTFLVECGVVEPGCVDVAERVYEPLDVVGTSGCMSVRFQNSLLSL